jgi:hypothetical protein
MLLTYEGTLKDDYIDWSRDAPPSGQALHVRVTVLDQEEDKHRGQRMAQALNSLAESGAFNKVDDPAQWQREIRADRPLPRGNE